MKRRTNPQDRQRGQGLVEFTLVVPVVLLIVVSVAELGLAFGNTYTIGYGSREGARVGSALATGGVDNCDSGDDPAGVDAAVVSAVQRILKSPGSNLDITNDNIEIIIFQATSTGQQVPGTQNIWRHQGVGAGVESSPGSGYFIDFAPVLVQWPACQRDNDGANPDSIGITVNYEHEFLTPLPSVINAITGGVLSLGLSETTIMSLNPSV